MTASDDRRGGAGAPGGLPLVLTVAQLARAAGLGDPRTALRLLQALDVPILRCGRRNVVVRAALEDLAPHLWLALRQRARRAAALGEE